MLSVSLTRGQVAGLFATLGVLAAGALYFALSASGLLALHALSEQAFRAIQWAGAGYLIWLGARMIVRSFRPQAEAAPAPTALSASRSFWQGFTTQAANPNLLVYFAALVPQFVDSGQPLGGQVAILAASSFVIEFTVLSLYAALAAQVGRRTAPRYQRFAERLAGVLLIAAGAGLAALRRA